MIIPPSQPHLLSHANFSRGQPENCGKKNHFPRLPGSPPEKSCPLGSLIEGDKQCLGRNSRHQLHVAEAFKSASSWGRGCGSVERCLPHMYEALALITSTGGEKKNVQVPVSLTESGQS